MSEMSSGPQGFPVFDGAAPRPSMKNFLFSAQGRIGRGRFWFGALMILLYTIVAGALLGAIGMATGAKTEDGSAGFSVEGAAAIPFLVMTFGYLVVTVWTGICLGIKRYHDRGKSGAWILVQLIPGIGALWYFIEAGCLRGTVGPNNYGEDPLA